MAKNTKNGNWKKIYGLDRWLKSLLRYMRIFEYQVVIEILREAIVE